MLMIWGGGILCKIVNIFSEFGLLACSILCLSICFLNSFQMQKDFRRYKASKRFNFPFIYGSSVLLWSGEMI